MTEFTEEKVLGVVREIARVASVLFDGEMCGRLLTGRAMDYLAGRAAGQGKYSLGDNIDYDAPVFERAKKLLLRLCLLAPEPLKVQCTLWEPVTGRADRMVQSINNGGPTRWPLKVEAHEAAEPMRRVMQTGEPVELTDGKTLTVLAPVRDSLGDVAAVVELTAPLTGPATAWS